MNDKFAGWWIQNSLNGSRKTHTISWRWVLLLRRKLYIRVEKSPNEFNKLGGLEIFIQKYRITENMPSKNVRIAACEIILHHFFVKIVMRHSIGSFRVRRHIFLSLSPMSSLLVAERHYRTHTHISWVLVMKIMNFLYNCASRVDGRYLIGTPP